MSNSAKKLVDRFADIKLNLAKLSRTEVLVGVPQDKNTRKDEMSNAAIAYINDKGSPAQNIPARPFMEPGVQEASPKISKQMMMAANKALTDPEEANVHLNRAGLIAQNSIRAKINSNIGPVLAEATLAARRRRGRTGTNTLVDTGQLRNSITYVVRKK